MSLLGFDAVGRWAPGQLPRSPYWRLTAAAGGSAITGVAVSFRESGIAAAGNDVLGGVAVAFGTNLGCAPGAFALAGRGAAFAPMEAAVGGAYALAGTAAGFAFSQSAAGAAYALAGTAIGEGVGEPAAPGSFAASGLPARFTIACTVGGATLALTLTPPTIWTLTRTGDDAEQVYGGIGHELVEREERKRLAAITRTAPPPLDRTTAPVFAPLAAPQPVPQPPAPPDASALRAAEPRLAAAARAKRRRQEAEILLLCA